MGEQRRSGIMRFKKNHHDYQKGLTAQEGNDEVI